MKKFLLIIACTLIALVSTGQVQNDSLQVQTLADRIIIALENSTHINGLIMLILILCVPYFTYHLMRILIWVKLNFAIKLILVICLFSPLIWLMFVSSIAVITYLTIFTILFLIDLIIYINSQGRADEILFLSKDYQNRTILFGGCMDSPTYSIEVTDIEPETIGRADKFFEYDNKCSSTTICYYLCVSPKKGDEPNQLIEGYWRYEYKIGDMTKYYFFRGLSDVITGQEINVPTEVMDMAWKYYLMNHLKVKINIFSRVKQALLKIIFHESPKYYLGRATHLPLHTFGAQKKNGDG